MTTYELEQGLNALRRDLVAIQSMDVREGDDQIIFIKFDKL